MFYHAYDSYLHNAFPYDELRPLTCNGVDTWGRLARRPCPVAAAYLTSADACSVIVSFCVSYSLTLIDALDTLAVMGNYTEFRRVTNHLTSTLRFDKDVDVSVFETNIRGRYDSYDCRLILEYCESVTFGFSRDGTLCVSVQWSVGYSLHILWLTVSKCKLSRDGHVLESFCN